MSKIITKLHKKLWKEFSIFIRKRDSDSFSGIGRCITCGVAKAWKEMDAGHYISRRCKAVLYDERNVHAQCKSCNGFYEGRKSEYARIIIEKYGKEVEEELNNRQWETKKFTASELEEMLLKYKKLNNE